MTDRGSLSRVVVETMEARGEVEDLQEKAGDQGRRGTPRRRRRVLDWTSFLLPRQSAVEWPLFLEDTCGGYEVASKGLYSVLRLGPLHNLHFEI